MIFKRLCIAFFLGILLTVLTVLFFRNTILTNFANRHLSNKGLPIELTVTDSQFDQVTLSDIKIGKSSVINQIHLGFRLRPHFNLNSLSIDIDKIDPNDFSSLQKDKTDLNEASSHSKYFEHCQKISSTEINLNLPDLDSFKVKVECEKDLLSILVDEFKYQGMGPFGLESKILINESPILSEFKVYVAQEVAAEGSGKYFSDSDEIEVEIKKSNNSLQLSKLIDQLAPKQIRDVLLSKSGTLQFDGKLRKSKNGLGFDVNLNARDISFKTKDYELKKANLKHSVIDYPSMKSKKNQSFKAKEFRMGASVHDISVIYEVESRDKVNVDKFAMKFEGTEVTANKFSVFPEKLKTGPTKFNIDQLELEKFLKLALGETAAATGTLEGHIEIHFKGKVPIIDSGELKAKGPGTIQYRPPTSKGPPDPNSFSTDPIEILNNYLYDFHYLSLSINMSSGEDYNMKMTLTALGKNPGYLNGKSLKLNVNLEQNLLAAFQAMMLSYNLPKRLEEKITNLGNQ